MTGEKENIKKVVEIMLEYALHNTTDAELAFQAGDYKKQSHYKGRAAAFYRAADVVEKELLNKTHIAGVKKLVKV